MNVTDCVAALIIAPVSLLFKFATMSFEKPFHRSPEEVARYLTDFLHDRGGEWDWDDFVSIPIADRRLEEIRQKAVALELPVSDSDAASLQELIARAEEIATSDRTAIA